MIKVFLSRPRDAMLPYAQEDKKIRPHELLFSYVHFASILDVLSDSVKVRCGKLEKTKEAISRPQRGGRRVLVFLP